LNLVVEATWAEGRDHDHETGQGHDPVDGPDPGLIHGHVDVQRPGEGQSHGQGQETGRREEAVVVTMAAVVSIVVDRNPATDRRNILHVQHDE